MKKRILILAVILALIFPLMTACSQGNTTATSTATTTTATTATSTTTTTTLTPTGVPGEVEATEFQGNKLTPISQQRNNALAGTQFIDKATYTLTVDGLVDKPLTLTYADLLAYPQIERFMPLDCVEGWSFNAKWTGPSLNSIFTDAGIKPGAQIVIFRTADVSSGYTSLDLAYIVDNDIILGMKDNDITLPPERGFPFQVVAMSKFGYKWAKWVTHIEISDDASFRGYWENFGYNNNADVDGPAFEP